jgi:hypothetical protein
MHDHHPRQPEATLPPHALDHSGTPMPTSDYAVQGLVSTSSSRALASCLDVKGEGDTHVQRYVGLDMRKLQRYCQYHVVLRRLRSRRRLCRTRSSACGKCRGSRTPCPPPPGCPSPLQSPGAACSTRSIGRSPPATHTRCRVSRTPRPPPPDRPPPLQSSVSECGAR